MGKSKAEVRQRFEGKHYPIHVVGRHIDVTEAMRKYAVEKLQKFEHFGGTVQDATIIMDMQRFTHHVDIIIDVNNIRIKVSGISNDMYTSIDEAIRKLKQKLTRYIHRIHEHHAKARADVDLEVNLIRLNPLDEINDQIEEANLQEIAQSLQPGRVVNRQTRPLKILTQEEAVMKMELSEDPFMVYRSEADRKLKVIYRLEQDRNYGIIQLPE